jgi:hypothetical protein
MVLKRAITEKQNNNMPKKKPMGVRYPSTFYAKLNRARIRAEHMDFASVEITKKCSDEWAALGLTDRKKYNDMFEEDKKRYTLEMEAFMDIAENEIDDEGT